MIRVITLVAIATLAAAVLSHSSIDHRMLISVVVSLAAIALVARSLFTGKVVVAILFFVVLGIFTPFRSRPFSQEFLSIFDLATLALFAASPLMLRKWTSPSISSLPRGG